jgi:hypothetical protein
MRLSRAIGDDMVCSKPGPKASNLINGRNAIVTGLIGFDTEHDTHVEIHPVWALAINVEPFFSGDGWVFFVRNSGNAGYCGGDQELVDFPNNRYTFRLPWKPGAASVTVADYEFHSYHTSNPSPSLQNGLIRIVPGQGVFITFLLDPPRQDGSLWDGELHLRWRSQN